MKAKFKQFIAKFQVHELLHYASSLSFHTILSLIPILIISLSIFMKLPAFDSLYEKIKSFIFSSMMPTQQEVISNYIDKFLSNTLSMGMFGIGFAVFISIMFFDDYEHIVNKIFKTKPRNFWHKLSTYWTMVTLIPLGLGASFYISSHLQKLLKSNSYTHEINILLPFPYLVIWVLFFVTYMISANTKVHFKSALLSSFIASLFWFVSKTIFVYYITYNKTYLSIYGSFSTVMFFFIWIYLSWIIFLFGLKLCYILNHEINSEDSNANSNLN